ncbi:immunoglobulin-like domain-containing protein [Enterococcus sp. DIV0187]|uniref:immunoglobulin-like domain-containing protein n=1 Tax=Enterococcus sp. DIV0187 TaxID=2774644 RepID=UPI003F207563
MKKKCLASLTLATIVMPTVFSTQSVSANDNGLSTTEVSQTGQALASTDTSAILEQSPAPETIKEQAPDPEVVSPALPEQTPVAEAVTTAEPTAPATQVEEVVTVSENQQNNETSDGNVQEQKAGIQPQDVNPFPPNIPTDSAPAINIIPVQTIYRGDVNYDPMAGVHAMDKTDGDITSKVTYTGSVNIHVAGKYTLVYSVTNSKGQTAFQTVIVDVVDKPSMYFIQLGDFSVPQGTDYIEHIRKYIIIKDVDGKVIPTESVNIQVSGFHSTEKLGIFKVEVAVLSKYNTITKKVINVRVFDTSKVRLDVKENNVVLNVGDSFDPCDYFKAYNIDYKGTETLLNLTNNDKNSGLFIRHNDVDTTKPGIYSVMCSARSTSGAYVAKSIRVYVLAKEKRVPEILIDNKQMNVGDKLTKDMILAWARTEDEQDVITGFKVVNGEIKVKVLDDTLVEPGVHQITFYAITPEGERSEKTITLTVRATGVSGDGANTSKDPTNSIDKGNLTEKNPVDTQGKTNDKPANIQHLNVNIKENDQKGNGKVKGTNEINSRKSVLPKTGDQLSSKLLSVTGLIMIVGICMTFFKRRKGTGAKP